VGRFRLTGTSRRRLRIQNTHRLYAAVSITSQSGRNTLDSQWRKEEHNQHRDQESQRRRRHDRAIIMLVPSPCFKRQRTFQPCFSDNCWHPCCYSRAPSVCLATPRAKLGRRMYVGVIGKVGTTIEAYSRAMVDPLSDSQGCANMCTPRTVMYDGSQIDENRIPRPYTASRGQRAADTLIQDPSPRTQVRPPHPKRSASTATLFHQLASSLGPGKAPLRAPSHAKSLNASRHRLLSRHSKHLPKLHGTASKAPKTRPRTASCLG
jgi:hypothetical protein